MSAAHNGGRIAVGAVAGAVGAVLGVAGANADAALELVRVGGPSVAVAVVFAVLFDRTLASIARADVARSKRDEARELEQSRQLAEHMARQESVLRDVAIALAALREALHD